MSFFKNTTLFVGILYILSFSSAAFADIGGNADRAREKVLLDELLHDPTYSSRVRPIGENGTGPTTVTVNLYIRDLSINEDKQEYDTQLTFRQQWTDERLRYDNKKDVPETLKYLTLIDHSQIWVPDTFFSNERQGHLHNILLPNVYVRIFPDGKILYSIRISLTLACPHRRSSDSFICPLRLASYGWTDENVLYNWKETEPVQISNDVILPHLDLDTYRTAKCDSTTNTGTYSCLRLSLEFKRTCS